MLLGKELVGNLIFISIKFFKSRHNSNYKHVLYVEYTVLSERLTRGF